MSLSLKLLGDFAVRDGTGATLSLPTRKTRALLGYLAVNADRPQPRERLMALLWSDRGERQARQSLNQALLSIRKLADTDGVALLDSDGERVTLRGDAVASDVGRFRSLIKDDPAEAAILYEGPFLDGLSVPDPAFENWLLATRSELHALACDALESAASSTEDTKKATGCARRLVALDPLREDAHRRLMQLLHAAGDRAAALRQYQACAEILKRELHVEPDAATRTLFEEIRQDERSKEETETPPLSPDTPPPLPDKPSIAVLQFQNLGDDPQADHLADGLTEDLTATLAKVPELFVIARYSTATYKGKGVQVQEVAEALGVRYVLAGSVQKSGDRLRITSQLIDAKSGHHLWAERYDRPMDDIFALQDEIVRRVLIELQVKFSEGDSARIASRGTRNLEAWLLRAQAFAENVETQRGVIRARELFEAAHRADPNWARPLGAIAGTHYYEARFGWSPSREDSIALCIEYAERAIALDSEDPVGYVALKNANVLLGNHDKALAITEKAVSIAPNDYAVLGVYGGSLLMSADDPNKAVAVFERAVRLSPILPTWFQRAYGLALHTAGRTDRAVSVFEELVRQNPEYLDGHALLAAAYVSANRFDAADAAVNKIQEQNPTYTASHILARVFFRNEERTERLRELLIRAGLPE